MISKLAGHPPLALHVTKQALGEPTQLARKVDQNPAVTAEEKRQLIDTPDGSMIQMAHAGNDAFAQIDKALGN